jgi:hypothetical protein
VFNQQSGAGFVAGASGKQMNFCTFACLSLLPRNAAMMNEIA